MHTDEALENRLLSCNFSTRPSIAKRNPIGKKCRPIPSLGWHEAASQFQPSIGSLSESGNFIAAGHHPPGAHAVE